MVGGVEAPSWFVLLRARDVAVGPAQRVVAAQFGVRGWVLLVASADLEHAVDLVRQAEGCGAWARLFWGTEAEARRWVAEVAEGPENWA